MRMIKPNRHHVILSALICLGMATSARADAGLDAASSVAQTQSHNGSIYALVNGEQITTREYNAELIDMLKNRFYHGQVPQGKEEETRKELTNTMVDRILLLQDAEKRGIKPDEAVVDRIIARWEARGKLNGPDRDLLIGQIRMIEGKRSQLDQLEKLVRGSVPQPTVEEVRAYYGQHPELFTEPEKLDLSVILVSVDPSSPVSAWADAYSQAQKIYDQVKNGADFAETARKVSGDKSAANGGDLGYLHRGMLPKGLDEKVDKFKVGEVVEPIKMLEGMAVFRLNDRIAPSQMKFDQVKERAEGLLFRERQDEAWKQNLERLRSQAKIEIFYTPPATRAGKQ
ncbi:MAG: peptidylprolyl isomerase [Gallionellaceae bacterium]